MSKTNFSVTREQILEHVSYDPASGEMRYVSDGFKRKAGDVIPADRSVINILGSSYSKLKLIWMLQTGEWPQHKINFRDFGSGDCSWESLSGEPAHSSVALTVQRLREVLDYNPGTGIFTWRIGRSSTGTKGEVAGCPGDKGYVYIRVDGRLYLAHQLAFLYMTGEFSEGALDHKDWVTSNNKWDNLRPATQSENQQNRSRAQSNNHASGLLGVYWSEQHKAWGAKVNLLGAQHHAGFHATPEAAHQGYLRVKQSLHPFSMLEAAC